MNIEQDPRGNLLSFRHQMDGTSRVVLDNGPFRTITIHCHTDQLQDLLASDLKAIRAHLMTRAPDHFRKKQDRLGPNDSQGSLPDRYRAGPR